MENKLSQFVFDRIGVPDFQKYLDLSSLRHKLISGNVANVSTPGYRSKDIDFQGEFARATSRTNHLAGTVTNANHLPLGQHKDKAPQVDEQKIQGDDMNSVDIDREASNMAQNELLYTVGARLLQRKFDSLRKAITSK
jgi:flagellar basal-body rod protein FlgB